MSLLVLVRHGKASAFNSTDYDELSEPGFEQARALGKYWVEQEATFDRVYVGPRRRHAQTHETVAKIMRDAGRAMPDPIALDELDEHHGIKLVFALLPQLANEDERIRNVVESMAKGEPPSPRDLLGAFRGIMRRWASGEISHEDVEPFAHFRARVLRALETMGEGIERGHTVAAFTSAGAVSAAVGESLGLDDPRVIDLSFALHNASLSELARSSDGWALRSFNATPHLADRRLITSV